MSELSLYHSQINSIHNKLHYLIENEVDQETGEMSEELVEKMEALELKKEEIIAALTFSYFEFKELGAAVQATYERYRDLRANYKKSMESCRKLLARVVPEGEKIKTGHYSISFRNNPGAVEADDFLNIEELHKTHPEFVKVTFELNKTRIKEELKAGRPVPEGIQLVQNKSIQIR